MAPKNPEDLVYKPNDNSLRNIWNVLKTINLWTKNIKPAGLKSALMMVGNLKSGTEVE